MGGNNLLPFAANLYPRKSRGSGHVAGLVRDALRIGRHGNFCNEHQHRTCEAIEHRTPNGLLVDFLYFAGLRVSGEGADWMDAALNGCDRAKISSSGTLCRTFQIRPRTLAYVGVGLPLGNSGAYSTHGEFFRVGIGKHVVERSVATMEGHGASSVWMYLALLPFYFLTVFASFFPWSIKLPALWKKLRAQRDGTDQFLLAGALIIFGIFTLVQTKLPHYTLPAFPLLALLVARRFESLRLARALPIAADRGLSRNRALPQPVPRKIFSKLTILSATAGLI